MYLKKMKEVLHVWGVACGTVLLLFFVFSQQGYGEDQDNQNPFRLAHSATIISDLNVADFRAAFKVWIMSVARDLQFEVDTDIPLMHSVDEMVDFALTTDVDGFVLLATELAELRKKIPFKSFALGEKNGSHGDEYLLLVNKASMVQSLEELQGADINVYKNPRMSLALPWLDTVLLEKKLGTAAEFFDKINLITDTSRVVLPVFFKTSKACLVTRDIFKVMAELNPQLEKQLHVVEVSPSLVHGGFAFRADIFSPFRSKILDAMAGFNKTDAGRQILTLTQADAIKVYPISIMDDSLALVEKHERLLASAGKQ